MDDMERPGPGHQQPGVDEATIEAVGMLSEAVEWIERARGRLYDFHQLIGHADELLGEAAGRLRAAGHRAHADAIERELVGRNVLDGRWTFQIVDEFDDAYYQPVHSTHTSVLGDLMGGRRHMYEARLKERRRTHGLPGHESRPAATHDPEHSGGAQPRAPRGV